MGAPATGEEGLFSARTERLQAALHRLSIVRLQSHGDLIALLGIVWTRQGFPSHLLR